MPADDTADARKVAEEIVAALGHVVDTCSACDRPIDGPGCDQDGAAVYLAAEPGAAGKAESILLAYAQRVREEGKKTAWLDHGCEVSALYGDDGEMQCCRCYGLDFKRSPWPVLVRRLGVLRNASIQRAEAAEAKLETMTATAKEIEDLFNSAARRARAAEAKLQEAHKQGIIRTSQLREAEAERDRLKAELAAARSLHSLADGARAGWFESWEAVSKEARSLRAQLSESQQRVDQSHEVALREAAALTCPSCRRPEMFLPAERDGNYWLHKLRRAPESDHAECRAGYILAALARPEAPTPEPECPGENCPMCSGEVCDLCGAGTRTRGPDDPPCEHDVADRHARPEAPTPPHIPMPEPSGGHDMRQGPCSCGAWHRPEAPTPALSKALQAKAARAKAVFEKLPPDEDEDPDHGF